MQGRAEIEKHIAFVLYPGLTPLDLVGPLQVFAFLGLIAPEYRAVVVGERIEPMESDTPIKLVPDKTFDEVPDPFVIIVPGGSAPTIRAMVNETIRDYLCSAAETAEIVGSVCTGAMILAAAGLLEGRRATTHWGFARHLEKLGARYVPERWVEDGKFITAAGVSAGIDMALHLAARLTSKEIAQQVQLTIEYDPEPPFGEIDWSKVDRSMYIPMVNEWIKEELSDHPDLLAELTG